jgi:hypothetical protein
MRMHAPGPDDFAMMKSGRPLLRASPTGAHRPRHRLIDGGIFEWGPRARRSRRSTTRACASCPCSGQARRDDRARRQQRAQVAEALVGAALAHAPARRGVPLRHHLPPHCAASAQSNPHSTTCPDQAGAAARAAHCIRLGCGSPAPTRRRSPSARTCR